MAFNIDDIRAGLALGGARPTLFQVQFTNPVSTDADDVTPFLVRATNLPSSTISPIEIPYFGRKMKIAGDRTFDVWQTTIMNDEDFRIRNALERWHNEINTLQSNLNVRGTSQPSLYKSVATVTQFGKDGNSLRTYRFEGLFPLELSPIDLDWEATDTIENFSVAWAYDYFTIEGDTGTISGV